MIQEFQDILKNGYSTQKVIQFLSCEKAELIAKTGMDYVFSTEEREELYDFYNFFMENYGEKTYRARMQNWGQEPYIFRLTEHLYKEDRANNLRHYFQTAPENIFREAVALKEKLLSIKREKILSCVNQEGEFKYELPDKQIDMYEDFVVSICLEMILKNGVMVVRVLGRKGEANQLFSVKSDEKGHWIPISKKVMEECHCTAPDGSTLEPEENLIYTEISKW